MAAVQEQVFLGQVRRAHALVAGLELHLLRQLLQLLDHDAAVGQPERQARPDLIVEDEDLQVLAQLAMVALLRLLQHLEVLAQLLLVAPGRAVDALEHGIVLVAAPVRARHRHQLERVRRDLPGVLEMRPAAQVLEGVVPVGADDDRPGRSRCRTRRRRPSPARRSAPACRAGPRKAARASSALTCAVDERILAGDDLAHPFLDLGQILGREGARPALSRRRPGRSRSRSPVSIAGPMAIFASG